MNVRQWDGAPVPGDGAPRRQAESDGAVPMRAAPDASDEDDQPQEPTEEPGYGHGV